MLTTTITRCAALLLLATPAAVQAFQPSVHAAVVGVRRTSNNSNMIQLSAHSQERRAFINTGAFAAASLLVSSPVVLPEPALAEGDDEIQEVYFGCGCFWHVQHEFAKAEKTILGRSDDELTARAGYAGGKLGRGKKDGKVCYHNGAGASDYGKLGHGEVVSLKIPTSKFQEFAVEYCKLFKDGMRPDQGGDRGLEYRNLVAFKGGSNNALTQQLIEASKATGDQLGFGVGKGSDDDIPKLVWIMDIDEFPFYVGEAYHQFHDGFAFGENYPDKYNALSQKYVNKGEDFGTCPNGR